MPSKSMTLNCFMMLLLTSWKQCEVHILEGNKTFDFSVHWATDVSSMLLIFLRLSNLRIVDVKEKEEILLGYSMMSSFKTRSKTSNLIAAMYIFVRRFVVNYIPNRFRLCCARSEWSRTQVVLYRPYSWLIYRWYPSKDSRNYQVVQALEMDK